MELSSLTNDQYRRLEATELMRALSSKACAQGGNPAEYYRTRWGSSPTAPIATKFFDLWTKAAVAPGTTTDPTWAAPLVVTQTASGFVALVRRASVLASLPITPVPFQTSLPHQTSGSSMSWVGELSPKPTTKLGFGKLTLAPTKASGIVVVSRELMTFAMPGSELVLQQILTNELVTFTDTALLSAAAATLASPAGILNGVTASATIAATLSAFFAARPHAIAPHWVTSPANVAALSAIDPQNVPARFKGYPLVLTPAAGVNLILLDAPVLVVADGGIELDVSDQAAVEMRDDVAAPTATTVFASLWQNNLVGVRVERYISWALPAGGAQFTATLT